MHILKIDTNNLVILNILKTYMAFVDLFIKNNN